MTKSKTSSTTKNHQTVTAKNHGNNEDNLDDEAGIAGSPTIDNENIDTMPSSQRSLRKTNKNSHNNSSSTMLPLADKSKDETNKSKNKVFKPYRGATLDSPLFHFIIEPMLPALRPILTQIYAVRWQMSRPLQTKLLPNCLPAFFGIHSLSFLTYGQLLLCLPLVIIILAGYYTTFVNPNVEKSGVFASFALFLVYFTANKANSVPAFVLGISFERMIPYHNLCSIVAVILSFAHGYVAYAYSGGGDGNEEESSDYLTNFSGAGSSDSSNDFGSRDRRLSSDDSQYALSGTDPNLGKFLLDGSNNTSGTLLTIAMTLLVATSIFPVFRRKCFDIWLWVHIGLAISTIIFCMMHEVTNILFVAFWWGLDIILRYAVMATCRYPKKASLRLVRSDIVEISFPNTPNFDYNAGQFVQFSVPQLGIMNFHPISISSAPHEQLVTLHVRALGGWSQSLVDLAMTTSEITILIEGPYGCLSIDIDDDSRYQMAVCVSGGIGVTHCQSIAKSLVHQQIQGRNLKQMRFVWTIRDFDMLNVLSLPQTSSLKNDIELAESGEENEDGMQEVVLSESNTVITPGVLHTDIFVTSKNASTQRSSNAEINSYLQRLDPSTNIYNGRPNLDALLEEVKQDAKRLGVTHVAVFGCGPKPLIDALQEACRAKTEKIIEIGRGVTFDVHEEIFDF